MADDSMETRPSGSIVDDEIRDNNETANAELLRSNPAPSEEVQRNSVSEENQVQLPDYVIKVDWSKLSEGGAAWLRNAMEYYVLEEEESYLLRTRKEAQDKLASTSSSSQESDESSEENQEQFPSHVIPVDYSEMSELGASWLRYAKEYRGLEEEESSLDELASTSSSSQESDLPRGDVPMSINAHRLQLNPDASEWYPPGYYRSEASRTNNQNQNPQSSSLNQPGSSQNQLSSNQNHPSSSQNQHPEQEKGQGDVDSSIQVRIHNEFEDGEDSKEYDWKSLPPSELGHAQEQGDVLPVSMTSQDEQASINSSSQSNKDRLMSVTPTHEDKSKKLLSDNDLAVTRKPFLWRNIKSKRIGTCTRKGCQYPPVPRTSFKRTIPPVIPQGHEHESRSNGQYEEEDEIQRNSRSTLPTMVECRNPPRWLNFKLVTKQRKGKFGMMQQVSFVNMNFSIPLPLFCLLVICFISYILFFVYLCYSFKL